MIEIKDMDKISFRTFGWVQDPSDFDSLHKVVSIFNEKSQIYEELVNHKIAELIEERDGRKRLLKELNSRPLKLKYRDLVGTAFSPRSSARCNGIVQATVKGQQRPFISDWPADNFVRWAQCLGFIKYNYYDDTFEITETGLNFSNSEEGIKRNEILEEAILSYSPAVRILNLLETGSEKTKFELGQKLGFVGEDGFTSLPQDILIMTLSNEEDTKAYSKGYDLPISQVDEMVRYVEENNKRDKGRNPNEWWNNFSKEISEFYFAFISGEFKGNIDEKLNRISIATNRNGIAIAIISLIKLANEIKAQRMKLEEVKSIFKNKVY